MTYKSNGKKECINLDLATTKFGACSSVAFVLSQAGVNERSEDNHTCRDMMESTFKTEVMNERTDTS